MALAQPPRRDDRAQAAQPRQHLDDERPELRAENGVVNENGAHARHVHVADVAAHENDAPGSEAHCAVSWDHASIMFCAGETRM